MIQCPLNGIDMAFPGCSHISLRVSPARYPIWQQTVLEVMLQIMLLDQVHSQLLGIINGGQPVTKPCCSGIVTYAHADMIGFGQTLAV